MNARRFHGFGALAALAVALLPGCGSQAGFTYFSGKTVTIVVPYGKGGGLDIYARTTAPFLQEYLPGSTVDVTNVTADGGNAGKNQVFAAPPDGLTLGFAPISGALMGEWAAQPGIAFRTADFSYIGRLNAEPHVLVASPRSGIATIRDIRRAGRITMGFTGSTSDDYSVALATARVLGFSVIPRTDFLSARDASLACVRGEVDATLFSDSNIHPQIDAQTLVPIAVFGFARLGTLPDTPTIFESIPADRQVLMKSLVGIYALDRVFIGPPGIPAGRLDALRAALDKAVADPNFRETMSKLGRPIDYLSGMGTRRLLEEILGNEREIKSLILESATGAH